MRPTSIKNRRHQKPPPTSIAKVAHCGVLPTETRMRHRDPPRILLTRPARPGDSRAVGDAETRADVSRRAAAACDNFRVVGEDADFLACNKPAGLLVHPTRPDGPPTLLDGLRELLAYELANGGRISIINRLDRETSGLVVIAKSAAAAREAGLAMEAREVGKVYRAAVFGWPGWEETLVDAPIVRLGEVAPSPVHLLRAVHPAGAPAETRFRVLARKSLPAAGPAPNDARRYAIVEARPLTGRTHQIRVHLSHLGHPVIGDKLYAAGPEPYLDFIRTGWTPALEKILWTPRHALHCHAMSLCGRNWEAAPGMGILSDSGEMGVARDSAGK